MKSMTKSELAFHAGVSTRTFSRWLTQHRERLRELGIKPANRIPLKRDSVFSFQFSFSYSIKCFILINHSL